MRISHGSGQVGLAHSARADQRDQARPGLEPCVDCGEIGSSSQEGDGSRMHVAGPESGQQRVYAPRSVRQTAGMNPLGQVRHVQAREPRGGELERQGTLLAEVIGHGLGVALGVSCVFSASAANSQAPGI